MGIIGYVYNSYAKDLQNKKPIIEYCFFLYGGIVTWYSRRQQTISISTFKTEYVAESRRAREGVWMQ